MAAHPARLERFADSSLDAAIDRIIDEAGVGDDGEAEMPWGENGGPPADQEDSWGEVSMWWVDRLSSADASLNDRMAWIWHNWFTTADEAYDGEKLTTDQLTLLYRHGLGDLRTLIHGVITSGAMLRYLDAAGSRAYNPNENLARELMELYTIGPQNYTEDDVRAGARALAGWEVDDEVARVWFDDSAAFVAPLIFLGAQDEWDTAKVVEVLVDHPSTAHRIAARIWRDLVGSELTPDQATQMGDRWREDGLQILPFVESVLRSDEFSDSMHQRYCTGLEWLIGARAIVDPDGNEESFDPWQLENLGQRPFAPPSPAGWPDGQYWTRPGSLLPRLQMVQNLDTPMVTDRIWTTSDILRTAGLPEADPVGPLIDAVLRNSGIDLPDRQRLAWRVALTCPTFQRH